MLDDTWRTIDDMAGHTHGTGANPVRAVENWHTLVEGGIRGLEPRLKLSPVDFLERRLVAGGALSATFATMHAVRRARNFADGDEISPSTYMTSGDPSWFEPIFSRAELIKSGLPDTTSARLFANLVLLDRSKEKRQEHTRIRETILAAAKRNDQKTLASQFIDEKALEALATNDAVDFLVQRSESMWGMAVHLVGDTR